MEVDHQRPPDDDGGGEQQPSTSSDNQNPSIATENEGNGSAEAPPTAAEAGAGAEAAGEAAEAAEPLDDNDDHLMCRVCRGNDGNLYYPCLCTGSIKYVHQECLVEWLKYSKKEVCELCNHKYSFTPIYRPDMPKALPLFDIIGGVLISTAQFAKTWIVYALVMSTWLGLVPLSAARIYNCIFYLSFHDIVSTPFQLLRTEHLFHDIIKGTLLLVVFVCTFISLVWLREQIIIGGPHDFLNVDDGTENANEDNYHHAQRETDGEDEEEDEEEEDDEQSEEEEEEIHGPPMNYMDNDDFFNHREAVERGHPAAVAYEERRRDIDAIRQRLPRENAAVPRYDDMRDDENEIVENEEERREHEQREQNLELIAAHLRENIIPAEIIEAAEPRRRRRREEEERDAIPEDPDQGADGDDNWRDWDRFGDELTWQRLLGLDGSFIFLEHVFWVISLHTLFTVTFAYIPFRFGNWFLYLVGLQGKITYFPSIIAMLIGYVQTAIIVYILHELMSLLKFRTMYRFFGVTFLIIKVFLLVFLEIGFFPVMCGCWMDVCTLPLFNATLSQRISTFATAPFMSVFLHWMVGMVYVFYSASFVILLREILRPGVLWFMRNLNDPDFNPIQEMIDLPFTRHFRRLVVSTTLFFSTILLIFYIPLNTITSLIPTLLPYNVSLTAETPLSELSLELLILQVIMPAILEHANGRTFTKFAVRLWCKVVGKALDLDQYLLSDNNNNQNNQQNNNNDAQRNQGGGLAAEHQALLLLREPRAYEPYERPSFFPIRVTILLILMAATTTFCSVILFILPVVIGRVLILLFTRHTNVHEAYTVAIGLYVLWLIGKFGAVVMKFFHGGRHMLKRAIMHYSYLGMRLFFVALPVVLLMPLLMGTYFQLVFISPMRLGYQQTALMFPYQDWAMGVVQMKIFGVMAMMGPDWWLKTELELLVTRGVENFAALHVLVRIVVPCTLYLSSFIAFPVVVVKTYAFVSGADPEFTMLLLRFSYPAFLCITSTVAFIRWQITKFAELAEKIKNDRYLVGTQLVNYERNGVRAQ